MPSGIPGIHTPAQWLGLVQSVGMVVCWRVRCRFGGPRWKKVGGVCILRRGRDQELPEQRGAGALWIL